ncbi:MAG: ABC transporter ATP-binding protein [Melioribacteraceae bacterium]
MLKLINLEKSFGNFTAVNKINLEIEKGELFGFLGPNGAGKTTTIKMITGLLYPTSGKIILDGMDVWENPIETKRKIGFIPDQPFLYDKLTGREFLEFSGGLFNLPIELIRRNISQISDKLKIGDWIDKRSEEYSQGMRQRIVIASALLHEPEFLIIDEPMVGLDPQSAFDVKNILKTIAKNGTTVFMSTHSLNVVDEICTHVGIINRGNLIFRDSIDALRLLINEQNKNIEELFIQLTAEE